MRAAFHSASAWPAPRTAGRITGLDVARCLAIIGMVAVHVGPTGHESALGLLYAVPHGRASILFLLLAGIGLSLLAAKWSTAALKARIFRTFVLFLLGGLALQHLEHEANIILATYGLLFAGGFLLVGASQRWLLILAAALLALGPLVFIWTQLAASELVSRTAPTFSDGLPVITAKLFVAGRYPVLTWAAPFLVGMWLGRCDLQSRQVQMRMILYGTMSAAGALALSAVARWSLGVPGDAPGWSHLYMASPHSLMPLWLISATGAATAVTGVCLWLGNRVRHPLRPAIELGRMALTFYVVHLIALHFWHDALTAHAPADALLKVLAMVAVAAVVAHLWLRMYRCGPLEALLSSPRHPGAGIRRHERTDESRYRPAERLDH